MRVFGLVRLLARQEAPLRGWRPAVTIAPAGNQALAFRAVPEGQKATPKQRLPLALAAAFGASALAAVAGQSLKSEMESASPPAPTEGALSPKEFRSFKLKETIGVTHDTKVFRFQLEPNQTVGLTVASCLFTRAPDGTGEDGKPKFTMRPYTPITEVTTQGYFDLMVKKYPTGKMSSHIHGLQPGDVLEMKGPLPKIQMTPNLKKAIGMVAGGTGITPMVQVIKHILNNPDDNTQVSLVFANKSSQDVLVKEQLDDLAAAHPNFKVFYVIDKEEEGWKGGVGHVSADILKKAFPPPSDKNLVMFCGPPGMEKFVAGAKNPDRSQGEVGGLFKELGYTKDQVFKF